MPAPRRPPRPVDPPMVPIALVGTLGWGVAALVLLIGDGPTSWLRICLAGCLLGIPLLALMAGHDRRRRGDARRRDRRPDHDRGRGQPCP